MPRKPEKKPARAKRPVRGKPAARPRPSARAKPAARTAAAKRSSSRPTPKKAATQRAAPSAPKRKAPATAPQPPAPPRPPSAASRPGMRLAGSASSRLTIKPGPPQGPRPQLELSTRPRPPGQRKLSEVDLDEDEVLIDGFEAVLDGRRVKVTAVLERTCVYVDSGGDRQLARKEDLLVEADKLPIRRRSVG